MKRFQRIISLLLALVLTLGTVPVTARAEETVPETTAAETTEVITEPTAGAAVPTEAETEPAGGTTAPTEAETQPTEGTTAPTEAETQPIEGTTAPTEETVPMETVENASQEAAYSIVDSGTCGENLIWTLDSEGTLTISGTGDMANYNAINSPWHANLSVFAVEISVGVTSIGSYAFKGCISLNSVTMPDSVTRIGDYAFDDCHALVYVALGNNVTSVGEGAFANSTNVSNVYFTGNAPAFGVNAFLNITATVYYPSNNASWTADVRQNYGGSITWASNSLATSGDCFEIKFYPNGASDENFTRNVVAGSALGNLPIPDFPEANFVGWYTEPYSGTKVSETMIPTEDIALYAHYLYDYKLTFDANGGTNCTPLFSSTIDGVNIFRFTKALVVYNHGGTVTNTNQYGVEIAVDANGKVIDSRAVNDTTQLIVPTDGFVLSGHAHWDPATSEHYGGCHFVWSILALNSEVYVSVDYSTGIVNVYDSYNEYLAGSKFGVNGETIGELPVPTRLGYVFDGWYTSRSGGTRISEEMILDTDTTLYARWSKESHETLEKLNEVDYLAFAQVAYEDFIEGETVYECLTRKGKWNKVWGEDGITYEELCLPISQWKVSYIPERHSEGFYAVAFTNSAGEAVLAYRGSKPANVFTDDDAAEDWLLNDLPMILLNASLPGNQFDQVIDAYNKTAALPGVHTIRVTGHSLGGLWGDIASGYSGCEGMTFNAISALDIMYALHPEELGKNFHGVDVWNFTDHANQFDILAGMTEAAASKLLFGTKLKPYVRHASNYGALKLAKNHSLKSLVIRNGDSLKINGETGSWKGSSGISNRMSDIYDRFPGLLQLVPNRSVDMGISGRDVFDKGLSIDERRTSYGGNGNDLITTSIQADTIIGGDSDDDLDGRFGSDTYIYYKGDGLDTIHDSGGQDKLILKNFDDDDILQIMEDIDEDYIYINCNDEDIVQIYKHNREYRAINLNSFKVYIDGVENDISWNFNKYHSGNSLLIHCPVDVEVLDAEGNVVYTVEDGAVGNYYTEYGNFYVFEEENGGYGKTLDLAEGYTTRIVGVDVGTMDIEYREGINGELTEPKTFADVPVTTDFTAIFEETEDGELVLAADTDGDNIVDTKIGYDGKAIPADGITLQQEYLALKPGETAQLEAEVQPTALAELLQWRVEGEEGILSVSRTGEVVAQNVGSVYVIASVSDGENEMTARCRIDVAETDALKPEKIDIEGVHLGTAAVTTELYSTDYAEFEVLLQLPQNDPNSMTAARTAAMAVEGMPNTGVTIDDARFVAPEVGVDLNDLFGLQVLDDRRIRIVPTQDAVDNPKTVAGRYTGKVEVLIQEEWMPAEEVLSLTVRKTMPRLKATVAPFNSFYSGQSQPIVIAGGTPVKIYEDASKTTAIPTWLELMEDGTLTLKEDAPLRSVAGVGYVRVETEEWRIPVSMTLSVRNVYKTPGLRLSASAVTMTTLAEQSDGVELKLLCNNRKETLEDLNVTGITAPEGYAVENFTVADGSFTLKTKAGFQPGRIPLTIAFGDTSVTTALNLVVRTTPVTLRLSSAAVTLNQAVADTAEIKVTAAPTDFRIEEPTIRLTGTEKVNGRNTTVDKLESGELDVRFENGVIRIATTYLTPKTATYKLYISAGGSREATATIRVIHAVPTVTYRASGVMDLSFPEQAAAIIPTFRNYSGGFEIEEMTAQNAKREEVTYFHLSQEGKQILVNCDETTPAGAYTLTLGLTLDDGTPVKNTVRVTVRRTAVRLKLSAARVTLNKELKDTATVSVSCLTKGYAFALAKEMISCDESRLTVSVNGNELTIGLAEDAEFGKTYPIEIHACEGAPVMRLNVAVLRENTVVRSTIRATGFIDVLRADSAITIKPSYINVGNVKKQTKLVIYSNADRDNFKTPMEEAKLPFDITVDAEGVFTLTANEKLDHSVAYRAKLVSIFGEGDTARTVESAMIPLSVRMGAARLTLTASGTTLFAKDRKDRAVIRFETADATLNDVAKVEFRDARQAAMFEIIGYGNGAYAIGFKDEKVHESLIATGKATSKAVVVPLNVFITGNKTARSNTTVNVKLTIMK